MKTRKVIPLTICSAMILTISQPSMTFARGSDGAALTSCAAIYTALVSVLSTTAANGRHHRMKEEAKLEQLRDDAAEFLVSDGGKPSAFLEGILADMRKELHETDEDAANLSDRELVIQVWAKINEMD